MLRHELVRDVHVHAADRAERSGQDHEEVEAASDLPAPEVAGCGGAPVVCREPGPGASDRSRGLDHLRRRHALLAANSGVNCAYRSFSAAMNESNVSQVRRSARRYAPVDPLSDEVAVKQLFIEKDVRDREQHGGFRSRIGRQPHVRLRRRVREPRVHDDQRAALRLRFDDPPGGPVRKRDSNRIVCAFA